MDLEKSEKKLTVLLKIRKILSFIKGKECFIGYHPFKFDPERPDVIGCSPKQQYLFIKIDTVNCIGVPHMKLIDGKISDTSSIESIISNTFPEKILVTNIQNYLNSEFTWEMVYESCDNFEAVSFLLNSVTFWKYLDVPKDWLLKS